MKLTAKDVSSPGARETVKVVLLDGAEVGVVWKARNTRSTWDSWKAQRGLGAAGRHAGNTYDYGEALRLAAGLQDVARVTEPATGRKGK